MWFILLAFGCHDAGPSVPTDLADTRPRHLVVSGHDFEVLLLDMDGQTVHRWAVDPAVHGVSTDRASFRRAWVQPDGGLLALIEYGSLWRLSVDSEVVWVVDDGNHHDVTLRDDRIYSLTEGDQVTAYSLSGERLHDVDLVSAALASPFPSLHDAMDEEDPLHPNSLFSIGGSLLISSRTTSMLLMLDLGSEQVDLAAGGDFVGQHDAQFISDDRILLLDNGTPASGSRPLEVAFPGLEVVWSGGAEATTRCCGTVQRLSDGSTLWTATTEGRALEVDVDGEVLWTFDSPFLDDAGVPHKLFDVHRIPYESLPESLR